MLRPKRNKQKIKILTTQDTEKLRCMFHTECCVWEKRAVTAEGEVIKYKINNISLFGVSSSVMNVKVKQSLYRPGVFQKVPGSYGSQITRQRHRIVVSLSALRSCRLYPQELLMVLISVRGWVDSRAIVRSKGLCKWKIPITLAGIEPATYRFVA